MTDCRGECSNDWKPEKMKLSSTGRHLLGNLEGLRLIVYKCSSGCDTVGYGHKLGPKESREPITKDQAEVLFTKDIAVFENAVNSLVTVRLNQNQFDALVVFVFNIGVNAFAKSTLLQLLNSGRIREAGMQFTRWIYASNPKRIVPGLVKRRKREQALFLESPGGADGST